MSRQGRQTPAVATPTEARAGRAVAPRFLPSSSLHLTCSLLVALVATDGNGLGRREWGKGRRAFSGTVQGGQQHAAGCKRYRSAPGGGVFCFRPRPNPCPNSDIPSRRPPLQECGNGGGRKERDTQLATTTDGERPVKKKGGRLCFKRCKGKGTKGCRTGGRAHGRLVYGSVRCSYFNVEFSPTFVWCAYFNAEFSPTFRTRKGDDYDGPLEDAGFEMLHPTYPNLRTQLFVFWLTLFVFWLTK